MEHLVSRDLETLAQLARRWRFPRRRLEYLGMTRGIAPAQVLAGTGLYGPEEQRRMLHAMLGLKKRGRLNVREWLRSKAAAGKPVVPDPAAGQPV